MVAETYVLQHKIFMLLQYCDKLVHTLLVNLLCLLFASTNTYKFSLRPPRQPIEFFFVCIRLFGLAHPFVRIGDYRK